MNGCTKIVMFHLASHAQTKHIVRGGGGAWRSAWKRRRSGKKWRHNGERGNRTSVLGFQKNVVVISTRCFERRKLLQKCLKRNPWLVPCPWKNRMNDSDDARSVSVSVFLSVLFLVRREFSYSEAKVVFYCSRQTRRLLLFLGPWIEFFTYDWSAWQ